MEKRDDGVAQPAAERKGVESAGANPAAAVVDVNAAADARPEVADASGPNESAGPEEELKRLRAEVERMRGERDGERDRHLRRMAELENRQRRMEKEGLQFKRQVEVELLASLLPLDDDLYRAAEALAAEKGELAEGVVLIRRNLQEMFTRFGVRRLEPTGEPFDPNRHEAVAMREEEGAANTVLEVMQVGYVLEDRVLRPARVVVSAPASAPEAGAEGEDGTVADSGNAAGGESD